MSRILLVLGGILSAYNLLQPDGVQRGLVGNIISRFEQRGFKLIALKLVHATPEHLEKRTSHDLSIHWIAIS